MQEKDFETVKKQDEKNKNERGAKSELYTKKSQAQQEENQQCESQAQQQNNQQCEIDNEELERRLNLAMQEREHEFLNSDNDKNLLDNNAQTKTKGSNDKDNNATKSKTKTSKIISGIIFGLLLLLLAYFTIGSLYCKSQKKIFYLFGAYTFNVVVTESMVPEIKVNDFVLAQKTDIKDISIGENVVFVCIDPMSKIYGQNIVHKVIKIDETDGVISLTTKGVNNSLEDEYKVTSANIVGKQVLKSTAIGAVFVFLSNWTNWLFVIVILICAYVAYLQVKKIIKESKKTETEKTAGKDEK